MGLGFPRPPRLLATLYAATLPFDIVPLLGGYAITTFSAAALAFVLIVHYARAQIPITFDPWLTGVFYVLILWTFATCLWSPVPGVAFAASAGMVVNVAMTILLVPVIADLWRLMLTAYTVACLLISISLIGGTAGESWQRVQFMGADENLTAYALAIGVAASIGMALSRPRHAVAFYALALTHSAAIAYTGSRTGIVALGSVGALAVVLVFIQQGRGFWRKVVPWLLLGLAIYGLTWLLGNGSLSPRILDFSDAGVAGDAERAGILDLFWQHSETWTLVGVGQDSDAYFLKETTGQFRSAHGLLWKTWVELGIIGVLIYGALVLQMSRSALRPCAWRPAKFALLAVSIPFWVSLGAQSSAIWWFVAAVILAGSTPRTSRIQQRHLQVPATSSRGSEGT